MIAMVSLLASVFANETLTSQGRNTYLLML
nr:MAG TPA: hypothetical protein [Caudoviricetes sp.]